MSFFDRNKDHLDEDAGARENAGHLHSEYDGRKRLTTYAEITLDRIEADPQTREFFDPEELDNLAKSLKKHGQKQAILVRWVEDRQKYVIIAGERRFRAAKIAELGSIECKVMAEDATAEDIAIAQVIENALRQDLRPSEKAKAYADLMEKQNLTATQLADEIHVNKSTISRTLALRELPGELQNEVDEGRLSVKDAIAQHKAGEGVAGAVGTQTRKAKKTKEVKISIGGFTVSVKARRLLSDELVAEALRKALVEIEGRSGQVKRAA